MRRNSTVPRLIQYALTLAWTLLGTSVETLEQDTNNERYKTVL
ncbi:unnamed protein product [Penicillium roqueforti FM164]|uniref:Genomic scaffold, ProqFM164S03 n=1 Tax=Penicillium roqueforti (strain FM164) TaxID=1365484 RepID=W6QDS6_PENRF|nr:unnamed protein product [Penicillium roqueforti FM164]